MNNMPDDYALLDSGNGAKLERFADVVLERPCAQAFWKPLLPAAEWATATAVFDRNHGNRWQRRDALPDSWPATLAGIRFRLSGTDFGHLGVFPEQRANWQWIRQMIAAAHRPLQVLNLFAYSGGATLAAAQAGATVCHLDASKGMVEWARENAAGNGLDKAPIRWIVDDAHKFMEREFRRQRRYDAIILDPPSFGRGAQGEVYKLERDLPRTLELCQQLLSEEPAFVLLSSHTPQCTPLTLSHLLRALLPASGLVTSGEMLLTGGPDILPVPNGSWACWRHNTLPERHEYA